MAEVSRRFPTNRYGVDHGGQTEWHVTWALLAHSSSLQPIWWPESKLQFWDKLMPYSFRQHRQTLFQRELAERETEDILDRALLKAHHSKLAGAISAPDYWRLESKIASLKKLRFTDEYERLQDRETYEYMKYKVAAEVGDAEEIEAFKLYERTYIES